MNSRKNSSVQASVETVIGSDMTVRGQIDGQEDLRVFGSIEGSIHLTETLFVEAGGVVQASIEAQDVVVSGIVVGDITATNSVTLNQDAKLVGNISSPRLVIVDGASLRGDVSMGEAPAKSSLARQSSARRSEGQVAKKRSPIRVDRSLVSRSTGTKPAASSRATRAKSKDDSETTIVVKHASLRKGQKPKEESKKAAQVAPAKKKKAKKARARIPARGKRRVERR